MCFDPILDASITMVSSQQAQGSSFWLWYPGQRVAHLHKAKIKTSQKRFKYVGYPGTFRQPVYQSYFRRDVTIEANEFIEWSGLGGRMRLSIDGDELDITDRSYQLGPGDHELLVAIDFADTLPCFYLKGLSFGTDDQWEVSLDKKEWTKACLLPSFSNSEVSPLTPNEHRALLPPKEVECKGDVNYAEGQWVFDGIGSIIIDFHYYELGRVACQVSGVGQVSLVVGQSIEEVTEASLECLEQRQIHKVSLSEMTYDIKSTQQACRYARISVEGQAVINGLVFEADIWPVKYRGHFTCDDTLMNDVWHMGGATIHTCMHEFYLDAIYRDGLPWALDGLCAMEAADTLFMDKQIGHQHLLSQLLPLTADKSDLGVLYLDFQLYTLLGIEFNYMARKERDFLLELKATLDHTLSIYCELQDEDGFISAKDFKKAHFFPDWAMDDESGPDCFGTPSYVQMILMHCFEFGAYVSEITGELSLSIKYLNLANELRKSVNRHFYDHDRGVFYNGYHRDGQLDQRVTIFAQVFGVLYDLIPESDYQTLWKSMDQGVVLRHTSISLNVYFELQALCKMGKAEAALDFMRTHFGKIIEDGDVRVYEDINRSGQRTLDFYGRKYGKSLCHAVLGAAPVITLSRYLLGVETELTENYSYKFNPCHSGLKFIEGRVPTPKGDIVIKIKEPVAQVRVPDGIVLRLAKHQTIDGNKIINKSGSYELERQSHENWR